jgi:hypothetical protein
MSCASASASSLWLKPMNTAVAKECDIAVAFAEAERSRGNDPAISGAIHRQPVSQQYGMRRDCWFFRVAVGHE